MKDFDFIPEPLIGGFVGEVVLPRDIADLKVWKRKPFDAGHALTDLFFMANATSGEATLSGGLLVRFEPGWILWSNKGLADRWGWQREAVEKFLVELEKCEAITRQAIGQGRKAIVLQQFGSRSTPEPQANGTVRTGILELEQERELKNYVPVEVAIEKFSTLGAPKFTEEEIRAAWLALTTNAVDGCWVTNYTKPPRPVSDWRVALENQMGIRRQFTGVAGVSTGDYKKNAAGQSPAQARFLLNRDLEVVRERINSRDALVLEPLPADLALEKELEKKLAALGTTENL